MILKIQAVLMPVILLPWEHTTGSEENDGILRDNPVHTPPQDRIYDIAHVPDSYRLTCSWRLMLFATQPPIVSIDLILLWFTISTFCVCCSKLWRYLYRRVPVPLESWPRATSQHLQCSPKSVLISISEIALQLWLQCRRLLSYLFW